MMAEEVANSHVYREPIGVVMGAAGLEEYLEHKAIQS